MKALLDADPHRFHGRLTTFFGAVTLWPLPGGAAVGELRHLRCVWHRGGTRFVYFDRCAHSVRLGPARNGVVVCTAYAQKC